MAIALDLTVFVALCGFCLAFLGLGIRILRLLRFELETNAQHVLIAIGLGLLSAEVLLFAAQFTQHIRLAFLAILALLIASVGLETKAILQRLRSLLNTAPIRQWLSGLLLVLIAIVLCVEFFAAMAPLTGSDAQHYHFTVQKLILENGFGPIFSNSHSFLCGQHHLLILLALALGSEKLALGFIFMGGAFSAGALAALAARWTSEHLALGTALLFLLTPVVFWQMSTAGAPDIFMAFFVGCVLIVLSQKIDHGVWRQALLAGLLTGGIAGAKYTGCIIALAIAVAFMAEFRSLRLLPFFALGSLISGVWPYLRNVIWTGNPVFPFLSRVFSADHTTAFGLASLASDTGATAHHNLARLFPYFFFASVQTNAPGFWDFFGPVVFALAPLTLIAVKNTREWRILLPVWLLASAGIFFSSGLPRFLLPLFPIGLCCAAAGFEQSLRRGWKITTAVAVTAGTSMILLGFAGLAFYCAKPVQVGVGWTSPQRYLEDRAQDYQIADALNRILDGPERSGPALIFFRHQYYLKVPYVNGDPGTSFEVDPERMKTAQQWKDYLRMKGIVYVVRAPDYPQVVADPLRQLEQKGELVPFAETRVGNWSGKRIDRTRVVEPVLVLKTNF